MRLEGTAGEEAVERGIAAQVVIARRCRKPARTCCGRLPVARPALFRRVLARSPYICPMPASGALAPSSSRAGRPTRRARTHTKHTDRQQTVHT